MKKLIFGLGAALLALILLPQAAQSQTTTRPEVGELAEVYRDDKRLNVTIVRLGKRENKQALVEIADLDHPWNKRIFKTVVVDVSRRVGEVVNTYWIQLDSKPWGLVVRDMNYGGLILNLREQGDTGKNVRLSISYSKELSAETSSEFLLTAYLNQEKNPKSSTARYNGKLAESRERAGGH